MIINKIIKDGLVDLAKRASVSYRIDNIILGKSVYTMKKCKSVFSDMNMCLLLLEQGYGFAYFQDKLDFQFAQKFVNKDIREIVKTPIPSYFKVAITDAIYSLLNNLNNRYMPKYLNGDLRTKAHIGSLRFSI